MTTPVAPNLDDNIVDAALEDVVEGGSGVRVGRYVVEEGDEEEEETLPLVRRERRSKACGDTPILASVGMMSIRGLTMSVINIVLEDAILEDLLLELLEIRVIDACVECPDKVSSAGLLAGPKVSLPVCLGTSALEDASAPEGASIGSPSTASMGVHVRSPMPRTDDVVVTSYVVPIGPIVPTTLKVSGLGTKNPMGVFGVEIPLGVHDTEIPMDVSSVEIPMGVALSLVGSDPSMLDPAHNATSINVLSSRSTLTLPALGFPLFLSNLQVFVSHATSLLPMGVFAYFCVHKVS